LPQPGALQHAPAFRAIVAEIRADIETQFATQLVFATKRRDRKAARAFLKRAMKRYGRPQAIVTDRLRSYGAAMKDIGVEQRQVCGRWLNNRAENSHQPFRRREGAMAWFRDIKTLQKFASAHASIHNHFNHDRHLNRREIFKQNRSAALAEWRQLAA
jgi:putative transposase